MKELSELLQFISKLKKVKRAGWVEKGVPLPESVADHSFQTAVMCMFLCKKLNVDTNKMIKMALVHDIAEAEFGDLIMERGRKVVASQQERFDRESKVVAELFSKADTGKDYFSLWQEFEKQETRDARILKQIEKLELAIQALQYQQEVDDLSVLDEFLENAEMHLKEPFLIELFNELKNQIKK